uniref:RdRp n=1 Tax=viral metagenome TaxID=1070528 RepID=A0A2V0RJV1_9ZZZZ
MSITETQAQMNEKVRQRYQTLRSMVETVGTEARPKGKDVMREVDISQMVRMERVGRFFLNILRDHPEAGNQAMEMIRGWAAADREGSRSNPVNNDFFPVVIRGHGEKEFPLYHPPAVLTQAGMDHLLRIGAIDKETFPKEGPAFLTNICVEPPRYEGDIIYISTTIMKDVPLKRVSESAGKGGAGWDENGHVSHTEPWVIRLGEARRYTPFHLTSIYLDWILLFEHSKLPWSECVKQGGQCLLTGTLYLACEWACRYGTKMRSTRVAKVDGYATQILDAWVGDKSVSIPDWMHKWRQRMHYKYISSVDVGYPEVKRTGLLEWSISSLQDAISVGLDGKTNSPGETRMPFVEKDDGAYPLQASALTTAAPLRFWLCLSACIETTGSLHLDDDDDEVPPFRTYYQGVLSYLGKRPGMLGRKLGKAVVVMYRLLLTDVNMMVPDRPMVRNDGSGLPFDADLKVRRIFDNWGLEIIRKNLEMPSASRDACALMIASKIPELKEGLYAIFVKYSGSEKAIQDNTFTMFNSKLGDVVTHLAAAGSIEGYSRSCLGSLPVSGYKSHMQRVKLEGIDASVPREADFDEEQIFTAALENMEVPDHPGFFKHLHELSNAKSAGADRIRFGVSARTLVPNLGVHASDDVENHVSNRKDVLHWTAGFLLSLATMLIAPLISSPFPLGLRSVPARIVRYIYNLPLGQQVLIRPMYKALELFMRYSEDGYSLAKRTGIPVADVAGSINTSIDCVHDPNLVVLAHDASALDQHIGPAHRAVWRRVMMHYFGDIATDIIRRLEEAAKERPSNMSYGELASHVLKTWDNAYFKTEIPSAPGAVLNVDTQPSGALTTAVDNTVVTMAMLRMIERKTGLAQLTREVWGDDCYVLHRLGAGASAVDVAAEAEELAYIGSGQKLGTVADSTSGRGVHFLQVYYLGGQAIQRRVAYDHEKSQAGSRLPGQVNELLDKAVKLASRGGNSTLLNILQIITVLEGSHTTQFGRQASTDFNSIAAPGGTTNMVLIGFGQPNSRLFLELTDWFHEDTTIEPAAKLDQPKDIGDRLLATHSDSPVTVSVGGVEHVKSIDEGDPVRYSFSELGDMSSKVLLRQERHSPFTNAQKRGSAYRELEQRGMLEKAYSNSIIRTGSIALGAVLREKRLAPKFKEHALVSKGFIPIRGVMTAPEKKRVAMSTHSGIRLGRMMIHYSMNESNYVMCLPNSMRNAPAPWSWKDARHNTYDVMSHDGTPAGSPYKILPHPYFSMPLATGLLLSFTGVHAGRSALRVRDGISLFSPARFRHDMTPEEVMGDLKRLSINAHDAYLRNVVGFSSAETETIKVNTNKISLYRDISTATDYASLADVQKSCSIIRVKELIRLTSPEAYTIMAGLDIDQANVIITHVISLLYESINIACSVVMPDPSARRMIPVPRITITTALD